MIRTSFGRRARRFAASAVLLLAISPNSPASATDIEPSSACNAHYDELQAAAGGEQPRGFVCVVFASGDHPPVFIDETKIGQLRGENHCHCDDVAGAAYVAPTASDPSAPLPNNPVSGWSIARVLAFLHLQAGDSQGEVHFVNINVPLSRSDNPVSIDAADIKAPMPPSEPVPVVFFDGQPAGFAVNGIAGSIDNRYVYVEVHTDGEILYPKIDVSPNPPRADHDVSLSAKNVLATDARRISYLWDVPDPAVKRRTDPAITYEFTGSYCNQYAKLVVRGTDSSYGRTRKKIGDGQGNCKAGDVAPPKRPKPPVTPTPTSQPAQTTPRLGAGVGEGTRPGAGASAQPPGKSTGSATGPAVAGAQSPAPSASTSTSVAPSATARENGTLVSGLLLNPQAGGGGGGAAPAPVSGAPPPVADPPRDAAKGVDLRWLWALVPAILIGLGAQLERRRR